MKNFQKGFISPLLLALVVILLIGGGAYVYVKKQANQPAAASQTTQDFLVKDILLKGSDGRYPDFTVPSGIVVDPTTFTFAGYHMKTAGVFYKDSKNLYWVVFPEPVYDISFSITRVPNGDPATFHALRTGSFDGDGYAADKNQFYCGPRPFLAINPSEAKVTVENGNEIVIVGDKKYRMTAQGNEIVKDSTKTCELILLNKY